MDMTGQGPRTLPGTLVFESAIMRDVKPTALRAGCKINIHLNILFRREDGYHILESLFLPLDHPFDTLHVRPGDRKDLQVTCNIPALSGTDNILHTAYETFCRSTGFRPQISVHLDKRIPSGAGLGGGSSDAAVLLQYCNSLLHSPLSSDEISALALEIGADVPFFLHNRPALVRGIGEVITPVDMDLHGLNLVLVCPEITVSTKMAYREWTNHPSQLPSLTSSWGADIDSLCISDVVLFNSLEPAVFTLFPMLRELKVGLLQSGAAGCVMSGSGSSLCAFFRGQEKVESAGSWLDERKIPYFHHHF